MVVTLGTDANYEIGTPGNATATIADLPVDAWRLQVFGPDANNPAIAGDTANIDDDALANLLEFMLAADPLTPDATALPVIAIEGADVTLTYTRPDDVGDLLYSIDEWTVANGWQPVGFTEDLLDDTGPNRVVKDRVPHLGMPQKMLRLRGTRP